MEVTWNVLTRTLFQVLYVAQDFATDVARQLCSGMVDPAIQSGSF